MRFTALFAALALASSAFASELVPSKTTRDVDVDTRALKQYNPLQMIEERGLVDICVDVKLSLAIELNKHCGTKIPDIFGKVDICICIGALPTFIDVSIVSQLAVALKGRDFVLNALTKIILGCGGKQTCQYPPHSRQLCQKGSPCAFDCKDGYTKQGQQCVCLAPNKECNGKCQATCGPQPSKRLDSPEHGGGSRVGSFNKRHGPSCPRGYSMCGVPNVDRRVEGVAGAVAMSKRSWECLDTRSNLESCGGCSIGLNAGSPTGQDCTAIANSSSVSCSAGACVVETCKKGFVPNPYKSGCIASLSA